jgi:hypothetical protein
MKYKTGDLFKCADESGDIALAILREIDKEGYYIIHWVAGDPNSNYRTHFSKEDLEKWFRKIQ